MDRMSDEERFDTWLKEVAADSYNRPPARVPRDEMWEVVASGLRDAAVADRRSAVATAPRRGWRSPAWGALAASLVLAAGIGIGYGLRGTVAPPDGRQVVTAPPADSVSTRSLDVAMLQHLSNAEALLVAYRGTQTDADGHVHSWARDVLSTTRLLLDSRAGADPLRRRLLEDLELILVQIVQLPGGAEEERQLIDETLAREQLMTRLRTTIPAGPTRGT
jgi:hypothetical protein